MSVPHTDDPTLAVVIERLDNLRTEVAALRGEVAAQQAGYVSRAEFDAWRAGIGRELSDVKASTAAAQSAAESRRTPGWSIAAVVVAIVAAAAALVPALAR